MSFKHSGEFLLVPYSDGEKWGFKDNSKNIILDAKYDQAYAFSEGLAAVKIDGKWGYINHDGKEIIPPIKYEKAGSFSEGLCMVCQNGKWGFINKKGEEIIPPERFDMVGDFIEGLAIACENDKYGFINKKGEVVIQLKYDFARNFSSKRAKVMQNKRFGFVNKKGNEVVPIKYNMVGDFFNELVLTRQNNEWALVDIDGEELLTLNYNFVWDIDNGGFYKVFKDGKYGFVNQHGEEIVLLKYEYVEDFKNDIALIKRDGHFGIIDRSGREIINPVYKKLNRMGDGIIKYSKPDGNNGFIDYYGNRVLDKEVTQTINSFSSFAEPSPDYFDDPRDGQHYPLVIIGNQTWIGSNLKFDIAGSSCYNNNCKQYGRYYTYAMAENACPEGWRLPTADDWNKLTEELGGSEKAYNILVDGDFKMKLDGYKYNNNKFEGVGDYGYLWIDKGEEKGVCLWFNSYEKSILQFSGGNKHLRNVRCIKE